MMSIIIHYSNTAYMSTLTWSQSGSVVTWKWHRSRTLHTSFLGRYAHAWTIFGRVTIVWGASPVLLMRRFNLSHIFSHLRLETSINGTFITLMLFEFRRLLLIWSVVLAAAAIASICCSLTWAIPQFEALCVGTERRLYYCYWTQC